MDTRFQLAQRYSKSGKDRLVLLFLADFDPEGTNIPETFVASLRDEFGVKDVTAVRVALTDAQVTEHNLPLSATAKKKSTRTKSFVRDHGEAVYELEALQPAVLEQILRDAIVSVLDTDLFRVFV